MSRISIATPVAIAISLVVTLVAPLAATASSSPSSSGALKMLNEWREKVGAGPVAEDPVQSLGCKNHANYYRLNKTTGHFEDNGRPGYSDSGRAAAESSVLAYYDFSLGPFDWEGAVYHRTGLLNPRLQSTGFWSEYGLQCMGVFGTSNGLATSSVTAYPYPYSNQRGVGTSFDCNERPNPCDYVPGNGGSRPIGFILSVGLNGPWTYFGGVDIGVASLTPDRGRPLSVEIQDSSHPRGENLDGGFAILPVAKLKPATWYTAFASGNAAADGKTLPFDVTWRFKTRTSPGTMSEGIVNFDLLGKLPPPQFKALRYRNGKLRMSWRESAGAVKYRVVLRSGGRTIRRTVRGTTATFRITYSRPSRFSVRAVSSSGRVSPATSFTF